MNFRLTSDDVKKALNPTVQNVIANMNSEQLENAITESKRRLEKNPQNETERVLLPILESRKIELIRKSEAEKFKDFFSEMDKKIYSE